MRKNRPVPSLDTGRTDREDAAARRLAMLAADLGHDLHDPTADRAIPEPPRWRTDPPEELRLRVAPTPWPGEAPEPDVPESGAPESHVPETHASEPDGPSGGVGGVPSLPRPGRHADRRRLRLPALPGIGAAHLAVLAVVVAVALAGTTWWLLRDRAVPVSTSTTGASAAPLVTASSDAPSEAAPSEAEASGTVTVDVTGKVRRPGIVVLDEGARVVDALEAAGGARRGVKDKGVNLARVLTDGEQIVVGRARAAGPPVSGGDGDGGPVNLNLADAAELEELPGVGPVTAAAIVEWREQHGGFRSVDQLIDVSGIGEKTLAEIAPHATV